MAGANANAVMFTLLATARQARPTWTSLRGVRHRRHAPMPGMPGVDADVAAERRLGWLGFRRCDEQAASSSTVAVVSATASQVFGYTPTDRRAGYTGQVCWSDCGANTSIAPLISRTSNLGNGFGEIGN